MSTLRSDANADNEWSDESSLASSSFNWEDASSTEALVRMNILWS